MIFFEIIQGWFASSATLVEVAPNDATQSQTIQQAIVVRIMTEPPTHTLFDGVEQNTIFDDANKPTLFEV